jgi:hypothetical protein
MSDTFGEVEWGSVEAPQPVQEKKSVPFLTLKEGDNFVRLISPKPLQYKRHWVTDSNGRLAKVNCSLDEDCPVFIEKTKSQCKGEQGEKAYLFKILDRATGEIKVLDAGSQIVNAIGDWVQNPSYGVPTEYDINILRAKKSTPKKGEPFKPLYTVEAMEKAPLSIEEKQLVADSENPNHENFIDLKQRAQPLSADSIKKILSKDAGSKSKPAPKASKTNFTKASAPVEDRSSSSDDENFDDIDWNS